MNTPEIRQAEPSDHGRVLAVLNDWWGGRHMVDMLPRLFFVHFRDTSFVAEHDGELAGFLVGLLSQAEPESAYVHFAGVNPLERGTGLGRELYECFFSVARTHGRTRVSCVTSPANDGSLAFHRAIGFELSLPQEDYDGPGADRVLLSRAI